MTENVGIELMAKLCRKVWEGVIPEDWANGTVLPLFKKWGAQREQTFLYPKITIISDVKLCCDLPFRHPSVVTDERIIFVLAPEEPPRVISAIPHTPSSVLLQWEPPSTESLNGVLLGYRVLYREVEEDPPSGAAPLPLAPPGLTQPSPIQAKLLDKFDVKVLNSSSLTFYELSHLEKFRRYEIVLSAFNAAGNGPSTTPIQVFVGEAVPSAAPRNVKVEGTSSSQLQVTWSPPPASSHTGDLQGYKVFYKTAPKHDGNESERIRVLYLPETSVRLKGLEGFTRYSVRIIAYNTAGQGPSSSIATGRTLPAAPSAPSFIHFADVLTSSLNVSWGEPAQPNGLLEGYHVLYHPITPVPGEIAMKVLLRSPPRPSPGSLHYSDEDIPSKYSSLEKTETNGSISHKDKLSDIPEGPAVHVPEPEPDVPSETDSSHSFVNHYISEPSYFSSWRRQRRDIHACCGPVSERGEAEGANPGGKPPPYPATEGFGPRSGMTAGLRPALRPAAMTGFSSFV
uniref:protein sidekick-1-like n=1 Tax=Myxine glutinosa TaxID=7769 RepID=UPI00358E061C